jgi:hypothetical protein
MPALSACGTQPHRADCPKPEPAPVEAAQPCPAAAQALPADFSSRPLAEQADLLLEAWLASQEDKRLCSDRHSALIRYTQGLTK